MSLSRFWRANSTFYVKESITIACPLFYFVFLLAKFNHNYSCYEKSAIITVWFCDVFLL